jgi:chaperone modulatory protein CbpM
VTYALARPRHLSLEQFCAACQLHPELVYRLVTLGLLEPVGTVGGRMAFDPRQVHVAARIRRLRSGLALNYAAIGLVLDLLDRIDELEAALRTDPLARGEGSSRWT